VTPSSDPLPTDLAAAGPGRMDTKRLLIRVEQGKGRKDRSKLSFGVE
jgi:hypothetical protein